tara:strand:- start:2306 stop:2620 length:315 start_codon:yes stop_codon:yes gene_type:complete
LVRDLLIAKRVLRLESELKRLDRYEAVILDDIGYVQQDREEMEVLFTFLAARYERRSALITNLRQQRPLTMRQGQDPSGVLVIVADDFLLTPGRARPPRLGVEL